jgi:hypothetical protein
MRSATRPPEGHADGRAAEDADRLLTEFFQSERPSSWPAAPVLRLARPATRARWAGPARGRFALAAGIALLVTGALALGPVFRDNSVPDPVNTLPSGKRTAPSHLKVKTWIEQPSDGPGAIRIEVIEEFPAR